MRISDWSSDVCSSDLLHVLGQPADVVMALADVGLAGPAAGRLDHVRVDRALCQPLRVGQLAGLFVEDLHEPVAEELALGFRILVPLDLLQLATPAVHPDHSPPPVPCPCPPPLCPF